jgi:hypothetical protein
MKYPVKLKNSLTHVTWWNKELPKLSAEMRSYLTRPEIQGKWVIGTLL